jgi:hypothetical protein
VVHSLEFHGNWLVEESNTKVHHKNIWSCLAGSARVKSSMLVIMAAAEAQNWF